MTWQFFDPNGALETSIPAVATSLLTGTLQAAQFPALTGDVTTSAGSLATTLATVNSNVGSFAAADITVNAKGLITAAVAAASSGSGSVVRASAPTIANPVITGGSIDNTPIGITTRALGYFSALRLYIGGFAGIFSHSNSADRTYTFPPYDATMATLSGTETFSSKKLDDASVSFVDNGDPTKQLKFELSGISSVTIRTLTPPNYDGTIATLAGAETFTNKSISASQINSGTLALTRGGGNADFSATGGANQYVKQSSVGGNFSVGLAGADLLVARASLGTGASFAISSIPQTFQTLLLILEWRSAVASLTDSGQIQFGDASLDTTAANYIGYRMVHIGTTPTQSAVENLGTVAQFRVIIPGASATANYTAYTMVWINNYSTSSRLKQVHIESGYAYGTSTGNIGEETAVNWWLNTSKALTQISVSCAGGNLASPSAYQLYGLGVPVMANDYNEIVNLETGKVDRVYLTDTEQAALDARRANAAQVRATEQAAEAARQLDFAELATAKADAALQVIDNDLTAVNNAIASWATATNAQKLDMILPILQGQKRLLQRQQGIVKVLKRLVN